jgi:thiol-disulfide isomerase/thioredoxin
VQVGIPVAMKFTALDGREVDTEKMLGKVILVHFWATWSGTYEECILPTQKAYQEYHDKGLEVIGINLDTGKETVEKLIADKSIPWPQYFDGKEWENRFVRLYGIKTIPTMWLIDRDGKLADMDVDWSNPARKMGEQKALDEFNKTYVLSEGEGLKYVPAPYLPGRLVYQRQKDGDARRPVPENWFFLWNGGLRGARRAYGQGTGWAIRDILRLLAGIHPREIEGDDELLKRRLLGDFIVRDGLPSEKIVSLFELILRRDIKLPMTMTFREVPREVIVARGKYRFSSVPGGRRDTIEIYGERLTVSQKEGGGRDRGELGQFLNSVGEYLERRMVNEVESPPEGSLEWHENFREEGRKTPELVLQHLTEQTGLRFAKETRRVRVLFVERTD